MGTWLSIALGGFFGANARYLIGQWAKKKLRTDVPIGTLAVNLIGSFLLGILIGGSFEGHVYHLIGVGFMGAFTTFSTMNVEAVQLYMKKKIAVSVIYLGITYIGGILLAFLGIYLSNV
ncbi:fluoride efflux transporter CrcB [Robertmurraya andreesenii]|uniref:Fluoride-specific ion channel FluC n=1 Tax=Anoxybacillus andreesenii TaxID=1325932 RepID=A0ABT9V761_9BACL|nr:fluoride efflux transporter CrcB [Robertmurraya andreesenii]MDQ0156675.1 CrcB protein [Robertmurraya andreesenii]